MAQPQILLNSNEKILWQGTPRQGIILEGGNICSMIAYIASAIWVFNIAIKATKNLSIFDIIIIISIIFSLLYVTIGTLMIDASIRKRTTYTLTSQRILISVGSGAGETGSFDLISLPKGRLRQLKKDGSGTIWFKRPYSIFDGGQTALTINGIAFESAKSFQARTRRSSVNVLERSLPIRAPEFRAIPDAAAVFEKIKQAQAAIPALPVAEDRKSGDQES